MKQLVDIVNFNADASCLSSKSWLEFLEGGKKSVFYQWLSNYVNLNKKITLGFPGATISDIASFNPEAIELLNEHRNIFEIIIRPYAHDIALLRTKNGFETNLKTGLKIIKKEFGKYTNYFLPPEFMLTNEQVWILENLKIEGTFIHPFRFNDEIKSRLPKQPYKLKGAFQSQINCIPFNEQLTNTYLDSIHQFDSKKWNTTIQKSKEEIVFNWRDGESSFLIPGGNARENFWLKNEAKNIERVFLYEKINGLNVISNFDLLPNHYHHYPVHSFTMWMKELRMLGFIERVKRIEDNLSKFNEQEFSLWLQVINSDILSAIEKNSPVINIKSNEKSKTKNNFTIWRSERGFEGEECLLMLENKLDRNNLNKVLSQKNIAHIKKLTARMNYLKKPQFNNLI